MNHPISFDLIFEVIFIDIKMYDFSFGLFLFHLWIGSVNKALKYRNKQIHDTDPERFNIL